MTRDKVQIAPHLLRHQHLLMTLMSMMTTFIIISTVPVTCQNITSTTQSPWSTLPYVSTNTTTQPVIIATTSVVDPDDDWDCGLATTDDTVKLLKEETNNQTSLLYLKLRFLNNDTDLTPIDFSDIIRDLLKNKGNDDVVDPSTWIWAREGKGTKLLSCSFDFRVLSLTTLSLGVKTMKPVDIILPPNDTTCFWNTTDGRKLNILAKSIVQLIEGTVPGANETHIGDIGDTVFKVCLERVDPNPNAIYKLLLDAHILRQLSTLYDCWKIVKGSKDVGHIIYRDKITSAWLVALYLAGLVVALFFPLFLVSVFTWKKPPQEINGRSWISLNTSPLPVGFKYSLYLWLPRSKSAVVGAIRALVTIMILFSLQYIPVLCSLLQDPGRFWAHKRALDRTGLLRTSKDYMYVLSDIVFCLVPSIIFAILCNTGHDRGLLRKTLRNSIAIEVSPCAVKEQACPDDDEQDSDIQVLKQNIKKNCFAILDINAWISAIYSKWVLVNVPGLIIRAFPLSYCGLLIAKTTIWCLLNDLTGAMMSIMAAITFYFFTIKIITIFIYAAQICTYTYTGFVINADEVGLIFTLVFLDTFFILTALSILYDKYYELFNQTMTVAEEIMKTKKENQTQVRLTATHERQAECFPGPADGSYSVNGEMKRSSASSVVDITQPELRLVEYTDKEVPMIEIELFKTIIEKYLPYRKTICKAMFRQLLPVVIVSICGYQVANDVVPIKNFYSMFNFLLSVALSGAIPAISDIMGRSRSEVMCSLESRKRDLRHFLMSYAEEKQRSVATDSVEIASSDDEGEDDDTARATEHDVMIPKSQACVI